jgi:hypothetical protein
MVNWQVTATTTYCNELGEEVTVMVYRDGKTRCTGQSRHSNYDKSNKSDRVKSVCIGAECSKVNQYRDKLMAEEQSGA